MTELIFYLIITISAHGQPIKVTITPVRTDEACEHLKSVVEYQMNATRNSRASNTNMIVSCVKERVSE